MTWKGSKMVLYWKSILILGLFIWPGSTFAAVSTPSIQLPVNNFNFGEAEEGSIIFHEYLMKNIGKEVLEIAEVRPG
jgi:hypothetical protein